MAAEIPNVNPDVLIMVSKSFLQSAAESKVVSVQAFQYFSIVHLVHYIRFCNVICNFELVRLQVIWCNWRDFEKIIIFARLIQFWNNSAVFLRNQLMEHIFTRIETKEKKDLQVLTLYIIISPISLYFSSRLYLFEIWLHIGNKRWPKHTFGMENCRSKLKNTRIQLYVNEISKL